MIVVGHAGHILGLEAGTGRTCWSIDIASLDHCSGCAGQPVAIQRSDEAVVYAACAGHVFRVSVADGSVSWHADVRHRGALETSLAAFSK